MRMMMIHVSSFMHFSRANNMWDYFVFRSLCNSQKHEYAFNLSQPLHVLIGVDFTPYTLNTYCELSPDWNLSSSSGGGGINAYKNNEQKEVKKGKIRFEQTQTLLGVVQSRRCHCIGCKPRTLAQATVGY
ncbi:hypothetical protein J6590_045244 [Homalodisca vitripennis]|nr:hypothetical protein J6590_045244 [Homalodisca vitripennis]